jgi:imidazolonepropionase
MSILINNARVVSTGTTSDGPLQSILIEGDHIAAIGPSIQTLRPVDRTIDAAGKCVIPGFVDCHTHACFAGDRLDEWDLKRRGATYLEILEKGGGIMSTVRAVRQASQSQLVDLLRERLDRILAAGTTTIEIKSGYGLSTVDELKMLRAIDEAGRTWPGTIVKTALLGHAVDPDIPDFFSETINTTLDAVHAEFPEIAVDVFCENGAWPLEQSTALLQRAVDLGHPVRGHVDQFTAMGMVQRAIGMGAMSVDHLEASGDAELNAIAASWDGERRGTYGVGLPVCGFHVDGRYAKLRTLIDRGAKVCIASNFNPGSAPSFSMPFAMGLAVRHCGLTQREALDAATHEPARMLGFDDRGELAPGKRADVVVLRHGDVRLVAYEVGVDPVSMVIAGGRIVREA